MALLPIDSILKSNATLYVRTSVYYVCWHTDMQLIQEQALSDMWPARVCMDAPMHSNFVP